MQRAKWALDDEELNTLKERAAYFELDKTKDFDEFKAKYANAVDNLSKDSYNDINKMNRKAKNSGAFSELQEYMSKKHIRDLADECGIDLKGITLNIDKNEELLKIPFAGRADSKSIGDITFFPNAFANKEELV